MVAHELPFLDHTSAAFAADPHGVLRAAREHSWLVRTPTGLGVLDYAGCNQVIVDPAFRPGVFEMMRRSTPTARPSSGRTLLGSEGADHQHLRRVVMPWFSSRRIETMRARTVALVDDLLAAVARNSSCDVVGDIATRIPPTVFCWMVGCDVDRGPELAHWSSIALQAFSGDPSVMDEVGAAIRRLRGFADDLIDEKQRAPGDDITSALLRAVADGVLTRADVSSMLTELLSASVDNTTHSMGLAVWLLCEHPDQWSAVAEGAAPIDRAVEECARFEPVIRHGNHVAGADASVHDVAVPEGTLVTVYLAAAHRDPAAFDDPETFDTTRRHTNPHLEFGLGRHFCVGAALARMEIQEVVRAVTTQWRSARIGAGARVRTALAGEVDSLPVTFDLAVPR